MTSSTTGRGAGPSPSRSAASPNDGAIGAVDSDLVASDIEVVVGGRADDVLRVPSRTTMSYELFGGPGADVLFGGDGDDVLSGGRGTDTVSFTASLAAVRVDLRRGRARGMGRDRLLGVEDVVGSRFGDLLHGNRLDNVLDGWRGADDIRGGAGDDDLTGEGGDDVLSGRSGRALLEGGGGRDSLTGGPDRDVLDGGPSRDGCSDLGEPRRSCELLV